MLRMATLFESHRGIQEKHSGADVGRGRNNMGARVQDAGAVLGDIYWHTLAGGNGKLKN